MAGQCQQVRQLADRRELGAAEQFDGFGAFPRAQVKFHWLREARQVVDAEHDVVAEGAHETQHTGITTPDVGERTQSEGRIRLAQVDHSPRPVQQ